MAKSIKCPVGYVPVNGKCILQINPTPGGGTGGEDPEFEDNHVCPEGYAWSDAFSVCVWMGNPEDEPE